MQTNNAHRDRETRLITLLSRRLDLAGEAQGRVRQGDGRPADAIKAERRATEREIADLGCRSVPV